MRACRHCGKELPPSRYVTCRLACAIALSRASARLPSRSQRIPAFLADVVGRWFFPKRRRWS